MWSIIFKFSGFIKIDGCHFSDIVHHRADTFRLFALFCNNVLLLSYIDHFVFLSPCSGHNNWPCTLCTEPCNPEVGEGSRYQSTNLIRRSSTASVYLPSAISWFLSSTRAITMILISSYENLYLDLNISGTSNRNDLSLHDHRK